MRTVQLLGTELLVLEQKEAMRHTLERMGGHDLAWAMSKKITASDVNKGQSRLLPTKGKITASDVNKGQSRLLSLGEQLLEEEQMELQTKGYVEVEVVDPRGKRHEMKLSYWPAVDKLVLNSGWNNLVRDNNLEAGVDCKLWSFRTRSKKLCFALGV